MARIKELLRTEEDEREEETKQNEHEASSHKPHWRKLKKKPGPKNKEEDERFSDGQVSLHSNHDMMNVFVFGIFSVSCATLQRRSSLQDLVNSKNTSYAPMLRKKTFPSVNGQIASM